jgi:DNA-binding MarR family transcriptional regulator
VSNQDLEQLGSELVTQAARVVRAVRRAVAQPAGLRVLSILDERGSLGITQLAEVDRCAQATMSGTVSALAERGWVRKVAHPDDARSSLVELTSDGRRALARLRRQNGRAVAERLAASSRHSPADVARAVAVLRDVVTLPSHHTGATAPEEGTP